MNYNFAEAVLRASTPTTLNGAIQKFLNDLELTDRQSLLVAQRQKAVRERATNNSTMNVEDSFLIGSYARDTQIRPVKAGEPSLDVDAILVLQSTESNLRKYYHNNDGGNQALIDLHKALDGYQGVTVKIDRPSVVIKWQDMMMELTPAFNAKGGGYLIPSKNSYAPRWIWTAPDLDASSLTAANKNCNNELKPLTKMLKSWNRNVGKMVGGFTVETQAFYSTQGGYKGFRIELPYFFDKLLESDNKLLAPPSNVGENIFISLTPANKAIITRSKEYIVRAFTEADQGNHKKAIELMGLVFGKPFPGVQ